MVRRLLFNIYAFFFFGLATPVLRFYSQARFELERALSVGITKLRKHYRKKSYVFYSQHII